MMNSQASANSIVANMQAGDSPLDFVNKNLQKAGMKVMEQPPIPTATPEQVATNTIPGVAVMPSAVVVLPPTTKESGGEFSMPIETPPAIIPQVATPTATAVKEEPKIDAVKAEATPGSADALLESVTKTKKTKDDSIKDLRTKTQTLEQELQTERAKFTELSEKVTRYESGEALPDVIKAKDERIEQLSHFEQIHGLKTSKEYRERYLDPLNDAQMEATQFAESYKVDPKILDKAMSMEDQKAVDDLLIKNFGTVGALKARDQLAKIASLYDELDAAEQAPGRTLEQLQTDARMAEAKRQTESMQKVNTNARGGWTKALEDIRATEEFPELTYIGDEQHDSMVKEILEGAAKEYGAWLKVMVHHGATNISPDEAKILAKRWLISQASSVIAKSRAHHYQRSENLIKDTKASAAYDYPQLGGASPIAAPPSGPRNRDQEARQLLDNVLHGRK